MNKEQMQNTMDIVEWAEKSMHVLGKIQLETQALPPCTLEEALSDRAYVLKWAKDCLFETPICMRTS